MSSSSPLKHSARSQNNVERRKYRRVADAVGLNIIRGESADLPAPQTQQLTNQPTHFVRLSPTGIRIVESTPFSIGEKLVVALRLCPENTTLQLHGVVACCGEEKSPDRRTKEYYAGVQFVGVASTAHKLLLQHIDHVLNQSYNVKPGAYATKLEKNSFTGNPW